jgi:hypothetical protein
MQAHPDETAFSAELEAGVQAAIAMPPGQEPPHDNIYGLGRLGMAVSNELARVIAADDTPFGKFDPRANKQVPGWVTLGNAKTWSMPDLGSVRPLTEVREEVATYGLVTEGAFRIAESCINNGKIAVSDTTVIAHSVLQLPEVATAEKHEQVSVLRASTGLIKLWATLNDTSQGDITLGKQDFQTAAGVDTRQYQAQAMDPQYFQFDPKRGAVGWSTEAREMIRVRRSQGRGCPALRTTVT